MANQQEQTSRQNPDQTAPVSVEPRRQDSDRPLDHNPPDFLLSVRLKYVKLGYHYLISKAIYLLLVPLLGISSAHLSALTARDLAQLWDQLRFNLITVVLCSTIMVFLVTLYFMTLPRKVYLVDFACYKPDDSACHKSDPARICTHETFMERSELTNVFTKENLAFQQRILERSGLGQRTYVPEAVLQVPPNRCMAEARAEAEAIMFGAVDQLLAKTGVKAKDIGILVVNCSVFNPTPLLSAMIVNHYKLRGNVNHNFYALVVSLESITLNWYFGNDRSMLVSNCLFRMGGAAILLSNRSSDRRRSKYQLIHTVRTHKSADDKSYNCAFQQEDDKKMIGVSLSKDLMAVAGEALKTNITTLGPLVLPMSEQLLFFATLVMKKVQKNLELTDWHSEPSRMTLYRFGNTSSSSLWYELAYSEAKGRIRKGDRTWQIGFGSGFKCNSAVWKALRTIDPAKEKNPWMDKIHEFPVHVPKAVSIGSTKK
ncbi:hypothetical protein EUGRSUZ_H00229 [Eucalyptus grandis]|uniref:Uncharacterized protein n=2 Tax=Eucalyptus grandis TaxID=71139 RepID=A0ACC3JKY5_EUCGR|nr:hypothetical protein EUGRSUZ_H00229 [Eucalyptus grandis]